MTYRITLYQGLKGIIIVLFVEYLYIPAAVVRQQTPIRLRYKHNKGNVIIIIIYDNNKCIIQKRVLTSLHYIYFYFLNEKLLLNPLKQIIQLSQITTTIISVCCFVLFTAR